MARKKHPSGPRSLFSFPQTARRANLINGFAGACLRRAFFSEPFMAKIFLPSHIWLAEKNGFSSDFFEIGGNNGSFRAPISDRCPEGTSKTRGKSSWDGFAENGMPFSGARSAIGAPKESEKTLVSRRKSPPGPPSLMGAQGAIFDGRRRVPRKFMELSGDREKIDFFFRAGKRADKGKIKI